LADVLTNTRKSRGAGTPSTLSSADVDRTCGNMGAALRKELAMGIEWTDSLAAVDWKEASALYRAAPLGDKSADHLCKVFTNSMFRCFAFEHGRLVGAGRALADGCDCSYLCDIAVLPSHQGSGLGKQIVQRLVDASRGHKKILLYALPGKEPFYKRFGFLRMKAAMAIFENQRQQLERGYLTEE
jgi:GNAT superfamily N-acetyltransferase